MSKFHFSADLSLLLVALIWGTSYGVIKSALFFYPVLGLLALRFAITFALLSPALRHLRHLGISEWGRIVGAGLVLLGIFLSETFGVQITSASNAAFLISLCVVMTPLVEWAWFKRAPTSLEWLAAALSLFGAFLLSGGSPTFKPGDLLIVLAALLRAVYVCMNKQVMQASRVSPLALTAVQSGVVSLGCIGLAFFVMHDQWQPVPSFREHGMFWLYMFYLVAACTLFCFFVQNHAVRRSSPTRVALLMGSEPVFGALAAYVWLHETLSLSAWIGGGLIVAASLLATVHKPQITAPPALPSGTHADLA
jgi:drug/metabolite transporter (DMT)-like permease